MPNASGHRRLGTKGDIGDDANGSGGGDVNDVAFDLGKLAQALVRRAGDPTADVWGDGAAQAIARAARQFGPLGNAWLRLGHAAEVPGVSVELFAGQCHRRQRPIAHAARRPPWFDGDSACVETPALRLASVPDGWLLQLGQGPVVVAADGATVLAAFSSRYAPLVHHVEYDLRPTLDRAPRVTGALCVLGSDVWPPNHAHWLLDTLPRLATLAGRDGFSVAVPSPLADLQRETLALCGIGPERIVELGPLAAVRADVLLATDDLAAPPHPAFKGAPWALRYLRRTIGAGAAPGRRRLYLSRADGRGRHVLNEAALLAALEPLGFTSLLSSRMPIAEQAAAFAAAECIIGVHGAGFASLAFAHPGTRVLEIFPSSYGTAAYAVLATAASLDYAYLVAEDIVPGAWSQLDDLRVDIAQVAAWVRS